MTDTIVPASLRIKQNFPLIKVSILLVSFSSLKTIISITVVVVLVVVVVVVVVVDDDVAVVIVYLACRWALLFFTSNRPAETSFRSIQ